MTEFATTGIAADIHLKESIIFDYMNSSAYLKNDCLKYVSLSEKGDMREIMVKLYDSLRWAENIPEAKNILIYNIDTHFKEKNHAVEYLETVYDKIFRSTSGKKLVYITDKNQFLFHA